MAPETIDIELPRNDPSRAANMRRGLLLVAKIIQNLANNIMFGKEAHSECESFRLRVRQQLTNIDVVSDYAQSIPAR